MGLRSYRICDMHENAVSTWTGLPDHCLVDYQSMRLKWDGEYVLQVVIPELA